MIAVDTRAKGVLPTTRAAMSTALTGDKEYIGYQNPNYFPLVFPLLFPAGGTSGWHPDLKSTKGNKISLMQWVGQLIMCEPRFDLLGPLVNEFLIDAFSCIEDERLAFHAMNQDKYKTSLHNAGAASRIPRPQLRSAPPVQRVIIPSSFKGGFADQAKKLTEAMAILRHYGGKPSYFVTATCNSVRNFVYRKYIFQLHQFFMHSTPSIIIAKLFTPPIPTISRTVFPLCTSSLL